MHELVVSFLSIILILTFVQEAKGLKSFLNRFPLLMQFVPTWSFFAPLPSIHDYHLLCRCFSSDGKAQDWREVYRVKERRPFYSFFWNPDKKVSKSFIDLVIGLIKLSNDVKDWNQISISLPYLHILNYINSFNHDHSMESIQFMILSDSQLFEYEVAFLSQRHPLAKK